MRLPARFPPRAQALQAGALTHFHPAQGNAMQKSQLATQFFDRLSQGAGDFIGKMIEAEMDAELIELFNKLGGQLQAGDMEQERFQASLLIIGYLVRAHEQNGGASAPAEPAPGAPRH
jgi:hypothetical protein